MNEEAACQQYLLDLLNADVTLTDMLESGCWLRSVPESARFPAVKIDRQDANDLYVINLHRVWADLTFLIRGVVHWTGSGQPDWTDVNEIGHRLDFLLHKHEGFNDLIEVHSFREEPFTDEIIEGGDLFLHVGGIYRVRAHPLVDAGDGTDATSLLLREWTLAELYEPVGAITRDVNEVPVTFAVLWPDDSGGVFITTATDATFGAINAFTITHTVSGKTVTQPEVTRDSEGAVSVHPGLVVS